MRKLRRRSKLRLDRRVVREPEPRAHRLTGRVEQKPRSECRDGIELPGERGRVAPDRLGLQPQRVGQVVELGRTLATVLRSVQRDIHGLPGIVERKGRHTGEVERDCMPAQRPPRVLRHHPDERPVQVDVHSSCWAFPDARVVGPVTALEVEDEAAVPEPVEHLLGSGERRRRYEQIEVGREPVVALEPAGDRRTFQHDHVDTSAGERADHGSRGLDEQHADRSREPRIGRPEPAHLTTLIRRGHGAPERIPGRLLASESRSLTPAGAGARRLLIVHASADLYGSDRACLAIARAAAAEYDVHVVVPWRGPLVARLQEVGATTYVFDPLVLRRSELRGRRALTTPFRWARALVGLRRFARRGRFDVVHSNCITTVGGRYLARRWRAPHVWHVHELFADDGVARRLFERLLRDADRIVAASSAVASQFHSPELRARCVVAHTGADVPETISRSVPLTHAPAHIVCVGRLNAWKGQGDLIAAVGLLRDEGVDVRLGLVGDVFADEHHFRDRLVAQVRALGLDERVSFLGERADALELMGAADVVVIPSASPEPFGMVVVEAMALGRPVIATAAGGPQEVVTDGVDGILVPPRDPRQMANAIAGLLADSARARKLGATAATTAARFSSAAMADRVLETYRELLAVP